MFFLLLLLRIQLLPSIFFSDSKFPSPSILQQFQIPPLDLPRAFLIDTAPAGPKRLRHPEEDLFLNS